VRRKIETASGLTGPHEPENRKKQKRRIYMEKQDRIEQWIDCCHTIKVLHNAGIETMTQLSEMSSEQILQLRGIGRVIAGDLQKKLEAYRENSDHLSCK
jgi:DNA-directed RNA polymerase alpha subunit